MYVYIETETERELCIVCVWMQSQQCWDIRVWLPLKQVHMYWSELKPVGYGQFWRAASVVTVLMEGDHHDARAGMCFASHGGARGTKQIFWGPLWAEDP